jgi:hypothetical protein
MFVYIYFMSNEHILVFSFIVMLLISLINVMEFLMLYINGECFCDEF